MTERLMKYPASLAPRYPLLELLPNNSANTVFLGVILATCWFGIAGLALYLNHNELLIGFDGGYMRNLAHRQFAWGIPLFFSSLDWFQGIGDLFFAVNFRLLPSFIAGSQFGVGIISKVITYEIVLFELSVSVFLFGCSLGASRLVSLAAAFLTCVVLLPFSQPALVYGLLALIPHAGSLIAGALLVAAAFLEFGRRSWLIDLVLAIAFFSILAWSILVSITVFMLAVPFLLLCALSGMLAANTAKERWRKVCLFAAVLLVFLAGPAIYFLGTILDTAAIVFPVELANDRASFYFASILFHWNSVGRTGPLLVVFAVIGACLTAFDRAQNTLRIFALTLLTYLGTRLLFAVAVIEFDFWRGPAALYFEFFVIPLYAIFCSIFVSRLVGLLCRKLKWTPALALQKAVLTILASAAVLFFSQKHSPSNYGFRYPPQPTPLTRVLETETALHVGAVFNGRTANMIGRSIERPINWLDLHNRDSKLTLQIGNELRLVGLNYFQIPTFFEYTPTMSPYFYLLASRLLALPSDRQMRNVVVLRKINYRILAMLGVRFVITDKKSEEHAATLRSEMPTKDGSLFLYEINDVNVGNYSPTRVRTLATARELIEELGNPDFDPRQEILTNVQKWMPARLTPARKARLHFEGADLRLTAESDGQSLLLIPLEFSHCLEATPNGLGKPTLFRANIAETGVLFSQALDIKLSIRAGPFLNPACRLRDFLESRDFRMSELSLAPSHL
jgi:hypothetical protein